MALKTLFPTRRWSYCTHCCRVVLFMLLGALAIFFGDQYIEFGMWNAHEYANYRGCSEQIYNFDNGPNYFVGVQDDTDLWKACHLNFSQAAKNDCGADLAGEDSNTPSAIQTKCGTVQPSLLSFRSVRKQPTTNTVTTFCVPNIVHYVSFGNWTFTYLNYLSFKSADKFIKPNFIFVHGTGLPVGDWWNRTLRDIPNVYHVEREQPMRIQGRKVGWLQHSSDVLRLQTLIDNGGIYLDTDILVLKTFDPLRRYSLTLGREHSFGLGNGIILARRRTLFLCIWMNVYRDYNPFIWNWAAYSVHTPHRISRRFPSEIHIEEDSMQRPNFFEAEKLFDDTIDWSRKHSIHVSKRHGYVPQCPQETWRLNSTLGQVMRYIYYDSKSLIYDGSSVVAGCQ